MDGDDTPKRYRIPVHLDVMSSRFETETLKLQNFDLLQPGLILAVALNPLENRVCSDAKTLLIKLYKGVSSIWFREGASPKFSVSGWQDTKKSHIFFKLLGPSNYF